MANFMRVMCGLAVFVVVGCRCGAPQLQQEQPKTAELTCGLEPIQNFGVGADIAISTRRDGFALAFATGTGEFNASPYYGNLVLLDRYIRVHKRLPLGQGKHLQVVRGRDDLLTVFMSNDDETMVWSQVESDGSGYRQQKMFQGTTFSSPQFVSSNQTAAHVSWINFQPETDCPVIMTGDVTDHLGLTNRRVHTAPTLRMGKCLPDSPGNFLTSFARTDKINVVGVRQTMTEDKNRSTLFAGQGGLQELRSHAWAYSTGEAYDIGGIKRIDQGFVAYLYHVKIEGDQRVEDMQFLLFDEQGRFLRAIPSPFPRFRSYDTDGTRIAMITNGDDGTKSFFFHLADMSGKELQSLKLETMATDWIVQARVIVVDSKTFFVVWGGGITAADALSEIHGSVVTCK